MIISTAGFFTVYPVHVAVCEPYRDTASTTLNERVPSAARGLILRLIRLGIQLVSKVFGTPFVVNLSARGQNNPLSVEMKNNVIQVSEARKVCMKRNLNTY